MVDIATSLDPIAAPPRRRRLVGWRIDPVVGICLAVVTVLVLVAVFADVAAPHSFTAIDLRARKVPPLLFGGTSAHPLGTDEVGRDILSRLFFALRTSLLVAMGAACVSFLLGTLLGLVAGFRGGFIEGVIRVFVDFQASMPFIVIALAILAFFGNNLLLFIALLGLYWWERYARLVSALTRLELEKGYVAALRRNGAGAARIAFHHILPNIVPVLIVNLTLAVPEIILLESSLSFLGLGIQPPLVSLGNMVGLGRDYVITQWWIATIPGLTIFVVSLSISVVGDWLRDRLDPTLR